MIKKVCCKSGVKLVENGESGEIRLESPIEAKSDRNIR